MGILHHIRQILLRDPTVRVIMRVKVELAFNRVVSAIIVLDFAGAGNLPVFPARTSAIARPIATSAVLDLGLVLTKNDSVRPAELRFRQPHHQRGIHCRLDNGNNLWIGKANILTGANH